MRTRTEILIPDPALVVLVGAAGAGKSTFAARHFAPGEVLSSDSFREQIAGDAANQSASGAAFAVLHRELRVRLREGRLTVVDATSIQRRARQPLLRRASDAGVSAVAIVLDLPAQVVLGRNSARPGRVVPEGAVRCQLADLKHSSRDGLLDHEGFTQVVWLTDPHLVDAVRIVRMAGTTG